MTANISAHVRWTGLLAATLLVTAGCADTSKDQGADGTASDIDYSTRVMNLEQPSGDPVQGGTLRVSEYSEARSFDPTTQYPTGSTGGNILAALYDTLIRYDAESQTFVPQLADSLTSDDNTGWTLTLRQGVTFSDGTPLDADAVVASMKRYMNSYGLNAVLLKKEVASIDPVDDLTVTITLRNPWGTFPDTLTNGFGMILAPAAYADPDPAKFKPIGAGPFTFESYAPAEKTVVVANKDYFDGRPNLDKIEFVVLGSDATAYDSFKSDGVDVAFVRGTEVVDDVITDKVAGIVSHAGLANNLWINTREGRPGEDPRVRKAIALAFDPEIYLQRTANGAGNPSKLLLGPDSVWSPGVDPMPTDPDAAKKLVEEAKADGFDGKVSVIARTEQTSQAGAVAIQAMLEAVGFEVTLDLVQNIADQTQKIQIDQDFDIATSSTALHDQNIFGRLSSALGKGSPSNVTGYDSPEMESLLKELQAKETPTEAKEVLTKIEALWAEDSPGVAVNSGAMVNIWQDDVHGIQGNGEASLLFDDAWIAK
ncbi:ABC transporter substrate-binding protein [Nocardioides jensenii]|uniref:ABC transporter substrate-binding protein n=1 Tax=Nocardioides jensenii TaxID=1843 RepID=UPI00083506A5|nr:ABC transporter substrate-binding protein [Nocardioides jensenii]